MKTIQTHFRVYLLLALFFSFITILPSSQFTVASEPIKIGIFIFENLEGVHTQSSNFGTQLGSKMMPWCGKVHIEDSVPLRSNETVRILDEMTKDRKVVVTTLLAYQKGGGIDYPAVVFADDDIKFIDLTWKVDGEKATEAAKKAGLNYCLIGTCKGLVTPPNKDTAAGKRNLSAVTASVNIRLQNVSNGEQEWMNTYRQVVSHSDPRIAFEQAVEMVADQIAEDLEAYFESDK